jgi:Tol biopolymer transport system component/DNA-binding winged helix-turn-helix (wHTH) protein
VDLSAGELRKRGIKIKIQKQPLQVLSILLQRPGEVVTREELHEALWPNGTFVEFDDGLNTSIRKIRQVLGDLADNPRFVETLPRKGYRFIAPLLNGCEPPPASPAPGRRRSLLWALTAGCVVLIAVAAGAAGWILNNRISTPEPEPAPVPLTSYPGSELAPSFSPDGSQVAFVWDGPRQESRDIYVKLIGIDPPVRLTTNGGNGPAWSPDGRLIAFHRWLTEGKCGVFLIPAIGGTERKLTEIAETTLGGDGAYLAWHPGGKWLVMPDRNSPSEPFALFLVSVDTGEKRKLTNPPQGFYGDQNSDVSPDGSTVVFVRTPDRIDPEMSDIFLLELSNVLTPKGEPLRLTHVNGRATNPVWMPGGRAILWSWGPTEDRTGLWKLELLSPGWRPGKAQRLAFAGEDVKTFAFSRQGRLAYAQSAGRRAHIWRQELSAGRAGTGAGKPPEELIASTRLDAGAQYSPDGKRITFASNRSGSFEIWVCNSDGSNATPLTSFGGPDTGDPRWSPDGRRIGFQHRAGREYQTYVVDPDGGRARPMTPGRFAGWSRDGKWIYFVADRSGQEQLWKMPTGGGAAVQVTKQGGFGAVESSDGKFLYYLEGDKEPFSLWRVPVEGGEETKVIEAVCLESFTLASQGIYFLNCWQGEIKFYDFATRKAATVLKVESDLAAGLSVSPDGRWLLYSRDEPDTTDLMLVENFR